MRWEDGFPCDNGSTDGQDSARLAGLMAVFNHPQELQPEMMEEYFDMISYTLGAYNYLRHPVEGNKYPFSRDQASCLFAGLRSVNRESFVVPYYKPKNDFISPSVRGHFKRCAGFKTRWYERAWLYLDVIYSAWVDPLAESNQLICMLMVANPKYLRLWCKLNKKWELSITTYWNTWRNEPELAELMISTIKSRL